VHTKTPAGTSSKCLADNIEEYVVQTFALETEPARLGGDLVASGAGRGFGMLNPLFIRELGNICNLLFIFLKDAS